MKKKVADWLKKPSLCKTDLWLLRFYPRDIVHGLQSRDLTMKEQLVVLSTLLKKYGKRMDVARRGYLKDQVEALGKHCQV